MISDSITNPNRYSHPGVAGRKPKPSTLVKKALALVDKKLPDIFAALIRKAIDDGDREAQIYLIDRRLGKPKQQTDIDLTGGELLGAGIVLEILKVVAEKRKELEGSYGQSVTITEDEGEGKALQGEVKSVTE